MVNQVAQDYRHLLDNDKDYYTGEPIVNPIIQVSLAKACMLATWGHDLIEDTRVSYNDVKEHLGQEAADIVYAKENESFLVNMGWDDSNTHPYYEMFSYLINLFNEE